VNRFGGLVFFFLASISIVQQMGWKVLDIGAGERRRGSRKPFEFGRLTNYCAELSRARRLGQARKGLHAGWIRERCARCRPGPVHPAPTCFSMTCGDGAMGGRSLGFPLETAESLCVVGEVVGKELQGDVATELQVFRLIHNSHAPAADFAEDAVMGDRLPHGFGGRGHWVDMLGGSRGKVNVRRRLGHYRGMSISER
jgi:hypothetical protein